MRQLAIIKTGLLALFSLILVLSIIFFPKQAFESSLRGLAIWWDVVFPALLPFFITSELLIGFGVVHFIGVLLEPFMKPLFRVPGVGGFVMSMGLASGNPMGAKLTVRLREQGIISRSEAERLVSFTGTAGPLFMFGAVAVGFFHDVRLGIIIASAHYLAAISVGVIMRFHDYKESSPRFDRSFGRRNVWFRALQAMHRARMKDGRTFGILMGDAVMSSIQTLLLIGGFIIMFSVIINIMSLIQISQIIAFLFSIILIPLGFSSDLSLPLVAGIFEITLGAQRASEIPVSIPLVQKVAIASAIIAWGGFSIHAQVASMLAKTDIRYKPYLISRILHALLAGIWTYLLWKPFEQLLTRYKPVNVDFMGNDKIVSWNWLTYFSFSTLIISVCLIILIVLIQWTKQISMTEKN